MLWRSKPKNDYGRCRGRCWNKTDAVLFTNQIHYIDTKWLYGLCDDFLALPFTNTKAGVSSSLLFPFLVPIIG